MTPSKPPHKKYVSCIKRNGVPILPPVITEEKRILCRLWQKEAMLVEKELALRKKEKELDELKALYESSLSSSVDLTSSSKPCQSRVMDLLRDAVYHNSTKDFNLLLQEVTMELKKFLTEPVIKLPKSKEFKFLLSELKKEILNRQDELSSLPPVDSVKNSDSTYNDVAHIILDHRSDTPNSFDTIREVSQLPERRSDNSNKSYCDISLHSESTFKPLNDFTPDDDSLSIANSLPVDGSRCSFYEQEMKSCSPRSGADASEGSSSKQVDVDQHDHFENGDENTPVKDIRRNSYTLESPSPSVLAYLRNLTLESSKEKHTPFDITQLDNANANKSVVRSLWGEPSSTKKCIDEVSPDLRDSLEDVDDVRFIENDVNQNIKCPEENALLTSYHEHQLAKSLQHQTDDNLRKISAAIVIQSYARGFFVRRLMRTHRIKQIKSTIKEAVVCAWGLYGEQAVTSADLHLHERIIQQVTAACYELHSIFFKWSTPEKMALIRADRERQKNMKPKTRVSRENSLSERSTSSLRSSRSSSRSRSQNSEPTHQRAKSSEVEIKRPCTLPSVRKSTIVNFQPWR